MITKASTCRMSVCYAETCNSRRETNNLTGLRFDTQSVVEVRQSARKQPVPSLREPHIPLNYEQIVWRMRTRQYTKVAFVVGAGASVAAGIPDF